MHSVESALEHQHFSFITASAKQNICIWLLAQPPGNVQHNSAAVRDGLSKFLSCNLCEWILSLLHHLVIYLLFLLVQPHVISFKKCPL